MGNAEYMGLFRQGVNLNGRQFFAKVS